MTHTIPPMPAVVRRLLEEVATAHGLGALDIISPSQRRRDAHARWDWYARILAEVRVNGQPPSLPLIGRWARRDHTTVLYGVRRHVSGLTWRKGQAVGGYSFGRPRGVLNIRLQLAADLAEAAR